MFTGISVLFPLTSLTLIILIFGFVAISLQVNVRFFLPPLMKIDFTSQLSEADTTGTTSRRFFIITVPFSSSSAIIS